MKNYNQQEYKDKLITSIIACLFTVKVIIVPLSNEKDFLFKPKYV